METRTMHGGLERASARFAGRDAIRAEEQSITFRDLEQRAVSCAGALQSRGVGAGDRVALMMSNRPEFVVAVHAVSKVGGASVLMNPAWKDLEVEHALSLTGSKHAIGDATTNALLANRLGSDRVTNVDEEPLEAGDLLPTGEFDGVGSEDDAVLVFSSGTTGLPKAVRHTHATITSAIDHWRWCLDLGADDRFQVATPPSHILGLLNLLTAIDTGSMVRLHRRYSLDSVLHSIEAERMTLDMAVAPIALSMANHPHLEDYDLSSLRYIVWGATPVTPSVAETVTRRTGVGFLAGYGATELPVIAVNPVRDPAAWRLDSVGLPAPGVEIRVVDLDTGGVLPFGGTGELQARGASVMAGYLPAEANAEAFVGDWYRTGDVGWLEPEGWVHLTDRSKEMIKVNGFQVAPAELESVLHGHPAVLDCAVFGLPDEHAGEVPVAAVQLDPQIPVDTEELVELVSTSLASYKRLRHVVVVDNVPRLPSGKVLRRELRDEWSPRLTEHGDTH